MLVKKKTGRKIFKHDFLENNRVLSQYLRDEHIDVEISNLYFKLQEKSFKDYLSEKKIDWIDFEFDIDASRGFRGVCYLTLDKANAEKLIQYNGTVYFYHYYN